MVRVYLNVDPTSCFRAASCIWCMFVACFLFAFYCLFTFLVSVPSARCRRFVQRAWSVAHVGAFGAWDARRSLCAAQTSRKKKLEGRLRNGPTYSRHYPRLRDYFLYFGTKQMIFMCYGRPCEHSELSFDSGPLDAIPAYKMPPHASSRLWETISRCYQFLGFTEIDFLLRKIIKR